MKDIHAALFDLDGTLLDSLGVWHTVDRNFFESRGIAYTEDYSRAVVSMSFRDAAEYTVSRYGLGDTPEELMDEWYRMVKEEYAEHIFLKPRAKQYLASLRRRGIHLAVATALPEELYLPALKHNGVTTWFEAFASTQETAHGKGFPDVYLLAAKRLNVKPEECAVYEDILPGIRGAKAAGMTAIGVYDSYSAGDEKAMRALADTYLSFD